MGHGEEFFFLFFVIRGSVGSGFLVAFQTVAAFDELRDGERDSAARGFVLVELLVTARTEIILCAFNDGLSTTRKAAELHHDVDFVK